jgi:hypothetical protein
VIDHSLQISAAGTSPPGPGTASLAALRDRLLHDRALQFDFTAAAPPALRRPPPWLEPLLKALDALGRWLDIVVGRGLPAVKIAFWIGVAVIVLLLIWLIARELLGVTWARRRREKKASLTLAVGPDPVRARALLENADRLAAQGRFDMAVRLILHRTVEDIEARRPRLLRPALTARDIASLEALPAAARSAFARIAAVVEFSAFAGQPIGRSAFDNCREAYEAFAVPGAWR